MHDEHTHNIGKLMLAFTCFWTYIAFSQLHADLDRRVSPRRFRSTSRASSRAGLASALLLIFGHFFLPFGALLSRSLKRNPTRLALVAALDPR